MTSDGFEIGFAAICNDHHMTELPPMLDKAQALGVEWIELPFLTMNLIAGCRIIPSQRDRLMQALAGRPLKFSAHAAIGLNFMDGPARRQLHVDLAKTSVDLCAEIGARRMVMHTGTIVSRDPVKIEDAYARQRDTLAELGDHAEDAGVLVCLENIFPFEEALHTATPARLATELAKLGHPAVRGTFDFSHGFIAATQDGLDFIAQAKALAPLAAHLHIHDSFGQPRSFGVYTENEAVAFGIGDLHLPVGWGGMPWDELWQSVTLAGDAVFMIELDKRFWPELAGTVARTRELAAAAWRAGSDTSTNEQVA